MAAAAATVLARNVLILDNVNDECLLLLFFFWIFLHIELDLGQQQHARAEASDLSSSERDVFHK